MKERIVLAFPTHTGPALWMGCRPHFNVTLLLLLSSQGGNFSAHLPFPPILQRKEKESELNPTPFFFNCVRRLLFSFPKKQKKIPPSVPLPFAHCDQGPLLYPSRKIYFPQMKRLWHFIVVA